jgi:hypothetical protein
MFWPAFTHPIYFFTKKMESYDVEMLSIQYARVDYDSDIQKNITRGIRQFYDVEWYFTIKPPHKVFLNICRKYLLPERLSETILGRWTRSWLWKSQMNIHHLHKNIKMGLITRESSLVIVRVENLFEKGQDGCIKLWQATDCWRIISIHHRTRALYWYRHIFGNLNEYE